jgi:hypothetical protein
MSWSFCSMLPVYGLIWHKGRRQGEQSSLISWDLVNHIETLFCSSPRRADSNSIAHVPSKMRLLFLDFFIIFLQLLLTTIAYETSLYNASPADTPDNLLPVSPLPYSPLPLLASPSSTTMGIHTKLFAPRDVSALIIDVRLAPVLARLRNAAPISHQSLTEPSLPLPNTTQWPLPTGLRTFIRARAEMRRRTDTFPSTRSEGDSGPSRALPGTMTSGDRD